MIWKFKTFKSKGYSMYTSSFRKPLEKEHWTSIWNNLMPTWDTNANNKRMASNLTIGAKVSSKSVPFSWLYPLATNLALFFINTLESCNLFLKIHLVPIISWSFGLGIRDQTRFFSKWLSSSCMANVQFGSFNTSTFCFGSIWDTDERNA